jgi:hypothetical protein
MTNTISVRDFVGGTRTDITVVIATGRYDNGNYAILFNILSTILRLQPLRY